jgi:hypothetical protein
MALMKRIKRVIDPPTILNPGKIFDNLEITETNYCGHEVTSKSLCCTGSSDKHS